jgi:hypothetical protein
VPRFRILLTAGGPAILLGSIVRGLLYLISVFFDPAQAAVGLASELASRVSWALIVCLALGFALAAARWRATAMTLAGLIAAPVGFQVARGVRRGMVGFLHLLDLGGQPSPIALGIIKGVEYACLGLALAVLTRRSLRGVTFALVGLIVGGIFGLITLAVTVAAAPLTVASLLTWAVNEIVFPIGCALVVWFAASRERVA